MNFDERLRSDPFEAQADPAEGFGWRPGPPVNPDPPRARRRRWRIARLAAVALAAIVLVAVLWAAWTAPLNRSLAPPPQPSTLFLASDGTPIARAGVNRGAPVDAVALPLHVRGAFIAVEDRRFRRHFGVDPRAMGRAAWRNARAGGVREGGSTITQQLAKTAFLRADQTLGRKLQEMVLALWLETWLTKDEILSRYLSTIYFGDGAYGLRAAARHYFSRAPEALTLSEAAMLAGLVKAPSRLAPTRDLAGAQRRARVVVAAMAREGMVSKAAAERLRPATLRLDRRAVPSGSWFTDWLGPQARGEAAGPYGEASVRTTLDRKFQRLAAGAVARGLAREGARRGAAQAALVAMRPDGRVVAMVGGRDYSRSPFNRATQARRQAGSAFKLFVYLAAQRNGRWPDDTVEDAPVTIEGWTPRNVDGRYRGDITLREAFAVSSNAAAVRLAEGAGRGSVIRAARDLGVTSPLSRHPSLALGTSGTTLIEMTSAYAAVAGGRFPVRAYGADRRDARTGGGALDPRREWPAMLDLLSSAARRGTGRAGALAVPTFAKTGTTQDHRDALYIGFAGDLVVGVWVGNDDNAPMRGVTGGGLPARIWRDFTGAATRLEPARAAPALAVYEESVRPAQARAAEQQDAPERPATDPLRELEALLPPEARRAIDAVEEWMGTGER